MALAGARHSKFQGTCNSGTEVAHYNVIRTVISTCTPKVGKIITQNPNKSPEGHYSADLLRSGSYKCLLLTLNPQAGQEV